MKFVVEHDILADAVTWAVRSLSNRPLLPILTGVLMNVTSNELTLSSFDYEISTKVTVNVEVDEPGQVLIFGRLLAEISRSLPNKPVTIFADNRKVEIICGSSRFLLQQMPMVDYPTLPTFPEVTGVISGDVFTQAVSQVTIAADKGNILPILTGVRVEIKGNRLRLLATDRYRLALRELIWSPNVVSISHVVLIPARTLLDIAKTLGALGSVQVAFGSATESEGRVGFEAGQRCATTRLLDGEYPKVTSIFPTSVDTVAIIKTTTFCEAVKRVSLVAERNTPVRLRFSEGQVTIEAGQSDDAHASEVVEVTLTGPELEIAFNTQFLFDGLTAIGTTYARMSFTQSSHPAVLSGQVEVDGDANESYRYVLMPVRFAS